jgi:hypothetical protein
VSKSEENVEKIEERRPQVNSNRNHAHEEEDYDGESEEEENEISNLARKSAQFVANIFHHSFTLHIKTLFLIVYTARNLIFY